MAGILWAMRRKMVQERKRPGHVGFCRLGRSWREMDRDRVERRYWFLICIEWDWGGRLISDDLLSLIIWRINGWISLHCDREPCGRSPSGGYKDFWHQLPRVKPHFMVWGHSPSLRLPFTANTNHNFGGPQATLTEFWPSGCTFTEMTQNSRKFSIHN